MEFSLVVGLLVLLIFGILEMGLAWRSKHTISDAANGGARSAAVGSSFPDADFLALRSVQRSLDRVNIEVDYVVVYRATSPEDLPSPSCMAGNVSAGANPCNVYRTADLSLLVDDFGCKPTSPDRFYCPTDRSSVVGSLDLVGVWVKGRSQSFTGLREYEFTSHVVLPIEPSSAS